MVVMAPAPKPRDPLQPAISPEDVSAEVRRLLSEPAETLADEAGQLEAAHRVLNEALQNN